MPYCRQLKGASTSGGWSRNERRHREVPMRQAVYGVLAARSESRVARVWPDKQIRKAFETAVAAAQLDDFRFHDLRHTFASNFVMRGGSLQSLKETLGHGSMAMTLRYAHLAPEHVRGEMERTASGAGDQSLVTLVRRSAYTDQQVST